MIRLMNVVVATDFGKPSDNALRYGRAVARNFGARLHVLHVVDDIVARGLEAEAPEVWNQAQREAEDHAETRLAERVTPEQRRSFGERAAILVSGNPAEGIVTFAKDVDADLIVMGTRGADAAGHTGLGSVAERVVHRAPCPVLTVKVSEREFVTLDEETAAIDHAR